jgi:MTH538 TIR-like domain (DUF1863)
LYSSSQKKICISFDWHNDRNYRNLLSAWLATPENPIDFQDLTPGAIDTKEIGRVKAVLTTQIRAATHTLVLIGEYANAAHEDQVEIGTRNWIWWEIEQSKAEGNQLIAVKIKSTNTTPNPIYDSGAKWAMSFTQSAIIKAINES